MSMFPFLILVTVLWFLYNVIGLARLKGTILSFGSPGMMFSVASSFGIALLAILGLNLIAKILIEIFK